MSRNPTPMNILLVLPSLLVGGAEVFVVRLANRLARRGHRVFLLHFDSARRSPLLEERISEGVTVVPFEYRLTTSRKVGWKLLYLLTKGRKSWQREVVFQRNKFTATQLTIFLEDFCQREKIQVINSHLLLADWMVAPYFWKKKRDQKFVISVHGCYNRINHRESSIFHKIAADHKRVLEAAQQIVLLTPKNARVLDEFALQNAPVFIPLGLEKISLATGVRNTESDNPFTFGLVSRAIPRKGWEEAIQATGQLRAEGIDCRLILVGGGESLEPLREAYGQLDYIHLAGPTAQVIDWMQQFDVGLFPSYIESESYPNTVIEYLSCGKPVVGTDIGEVQNMMTTPDGQHLAGQLLSYDPAGISVTELADCMRRYVKDRALRQKHAGFARSAAEKFDLDRCVDAYEAVYR